MVLIGEGVYDVPHDHIAIDNIAASHVAVQHLVSLDRYRIAFIGAQAGDHRQSAHLRLRGYREAPGGRGARRRRRWPRRRRRSAGPTACWRCATCWRGAQPPDAVFAYNDLVAIGAMRAVAEAGMRIPDDIAVIGIDDIEEGRFMFSPARN